MSLDQHTRELPRSKSLGGGRGVTWGTILGKVALAIKAVEVAPTPLHEDLALRDEAAVDPQIHRERHPDSERFGPFYLTFTVKRPPSGAWQAMCPYHALNHSTGCTKSMKISEGQPKELVKRMLKAWCLQAPLFNRRRLHGEVQPKSLALLPDAVMQERVLDLPAPPQPLLPDSVLDGQEEPEGLAL